MENKNEKNCCHLPRPFTPVREDQEEFIGKKKDPNKSNMVLLKGSTFLMGTDDKEGFPQDGEGPVREITLSPFYIDATTVTNAVFSEFISQTKYVTDAEKFGWSFVLFHLLSKKLLDTHPKVAVQTPWWYAIDGASWNHPEGPETNILDRMDHPVVHISWNDAIAFCEWSGKRLPTEAEWEFAARGGLVQKKFPWGDELMEGGVHHCNVWQGEFPKYNSLEDGYLGTAPAKSFEPNGYGLYNCCGNVWEWCNGWFSPDFHLRDTQINPRGPDSGTNRVMRGGSFLCHDSYCNRYRVAARSSNSPDSSTSNLGFRCAAD